MSILYRSESAVRVPTGKVLIFLYNSKHKSTRINRIIYKVNAENSVDKFINRIKYFMNINYVFLLYYFHAIDF
jgi:hypothetical protein